MGTVPDNDCGHVSSALIVLFYENMEEDIIFDRTGMARLPALNVLQICKLYISYVPVDTSHTV